MKITPPLSDVSTPASSDNNKKRKAENSPSASQPILSLAHRLSGSGGSSRNSRLTPPLSSTPSLLDRISSTNSRPSSPLTVNLHTPHEEVPRSPKRAKLLDRIEATSSGATIPPHTTQNISPAVPFAPPSFLPAKPQWTTSSPPSGGFSSGSSPSHTSHPSPAQQQKQDAALHTSPVDIRIRGATTTRVASPPGQSVTSTAAEAVPTLPPPSTTPPLAPIKSWTIKGAAVAAAKVSPVSLERREPGRLVVRAATAPKYEPEVSHREGKISLNRERYQ